MPDKLKNKTNTTHKHKLQSLVFCVIFGRWHDKMADNIMVEIALNH